MGNTGFRVVHTTEMTNPAPQSTEKSGAQITFAIGDINGSWLNILTDKGCEQTDAAKVRDSALVISSGHFGHMRSIQNSNSLENTIIPIVEPADSANEILTLVVGSIAISTIMHIPIAFSGAGRRRLKNANIAIYAIKAARRADIGIAAQIR